MAEYTDIQVIVMEDDAGNEMELQIADEFDFNGEHILALCPPPDANEDEDEISFFLCGEEEGDDLSLMLIEDKKTVDMLAGILEERLLARS